MLVADVDRVYDEDVWPHSTPKQFGALHGGDTLQQELGWMSVAPTFEHQHSVRVTHALGGSLSSA